ncbi:hypothetical protein SASPL_157204 [Salvia splendens]|uniref:Reverse transcriptase Ty1/copia-type domain-containing protein n=1 Tax=Salvia splendens TaxID=180675 RepID=A0A8X8VV93_SALSN|nr:hypothetical protein SASPL_157204 [Salvia splendens]
MATGMNSMAFSDSDEEEQVFSPQTLRIANDPTLYTKKSGGVGGGNLLLAVCVFMDDVVYMGSSPSATTEFKERMINLFEMTDLGLMHHFLGLEIKQGEGGVFVSQAKYAANLLHRFNVTNCESAITTPINADEKLLIADDGSGKADARRFRSLVQGVVCLTRTRPDIAFAVARLDLGIWYSNGAEFKLSGFTSSDWDGDRGSRSGFVFSFGSGAVTWSSRKQGVATLSSSEAEYLAAASSASEAMWLRRQLEHIDVELDLIRELVGGGFISLKFCSDSHNLQISSLRVRNMSTSQHNLGFALIDRGFVEDW